LIPVGIHAFNPGPMTGEGNWTWLIPGREPTLIDAGTGDPRFLAALDAALAGARLARVLVTHGHVDHASGAPALAQRTPALEFSKMPWVERDNRWPVEWTPLADDEVVAAGDTQLRVLHTPGHAPDHLCLWHEPTRGVFCGDLVVKGTTVWIPGNEHGDVGAYIASLERVLALQPARLYPAHGPIIDDPAPLLAKYIAHRLEREAQVIAALQHGDTTAAQITARIYRGMNEQLAPLARESVTAHLRKLERDGRVGRDAATGAWHIMEP
jgi:glyoxylase-like metal-dependent hydrolase (beta-lactamase superfamily II)